MKEARRLNGVEGKGKTNFLNTLLDSQPLSGLMISVTKYSMDATKGSVVQKKVNLTLIT